MSALPPIIPIPINLIGLDDNGRPAVVNQPKIRVSMIVETMRGPDRPTIDELEGAWHKVTRADVYAALCYYELHKAEIEAQIASEDEAMDQLFARQDVLNAPVLERIRRLREQKPREQPLPEVERG